MSFGPIIRRELISSSRRWGTYAARSASALTVLAILAVNAAAWGWSGADRDSLAGRARFCLIAFAAVILVQVWATMILILGEVAPLIAAERERKTIDALVATRLSSLEIVLGTLCAGLLKHVSGFLVAFPLIVAMIPLGGIDPRLVGWAYLGMLATMFAMAALAMAASIGASNRRSAIHISGVLAFGWIMLPFLAAFILPRAWPILGRWVVDPALVLLDSGPLGVFTNIIGLLRRRDLVDQIIRMIAGELIGGVLLIAWAVARLRPACRAVYDGEILSYWRRLGRQRRRRRWPPCGDDPIFWRERYMTRGAGAAERILGQACNVLAVGSFIFLTYWFAEPAFRELRLDGYGPSSLKSPDYAISPIGSALVRGRSGPAPGTARLEFNALIRQVTGLIGMCYALALAGFAAEGIAVERIKDTWLGLIATPLGGKAILRAKFASAIWRIRWLAAVLLSFWATGLATGAIHPVGFVLASFELIAASWFLAAFGTYCSLRGRDLNQASTWALIPVIILVFSALMLRVPALSMTSVLWGGLSVPFRMMLCLASYDDVRNMATSGNFPELGSLGVETVDGAGRVVLAYVVGLFVQVVGGVAFMRAGIRQFDAAVGRPVRPKRAGEARAAGAVRALATAALPLKP